MSTDTANNTKRSKADMTVGIQTQGRAVSQGLVSICDSDRVLLQSEGPKKRHRKSLLKAAESLIQLQKSVVEKIPSLVPSDCTKYSLGRLQASNNQIANTASQVFATREKLRIRTFQVDGVAIPLPQNTL